MAQPKHAKLAQIMRSEILTGVRRPHDLIPTEVELCARHGLARGTVRQALDTLATEGLIRSEQGRGTYVAASSPMSRYFSLSSFDDDMRSQNRVPSTSVIEAGITSPDEVARRKLRLDPADSVMRIQRLRLADGTPAAVEQRQLPVDLCPDLLDEDLSHQSMHWLLAVKYGIPISRIEHVVDRRTARLSEQQQLGLAPGSQVLAIERLTFMPSGGGIQPAVWFVSVSREDLYATATREETI